MAAARRLSELRSDVQRAVAALAGPGPKLVAIGGGADSAVLAWAAAATSRNEAVRAAFVDHGPGGSDGLETAARSVAGTIGIPVEILPAPVDPGSGFENRARDARRSALLDALRAEECLLLGHSRDDVAETVLMNLLRGSGAAGLTAIPARSGPVLRPLLGFGRDELRSLADDLQIPYMDDPANDDPAHLRNRVRHELIPLLEADYNPAARRVLARNAAVLAADENALAHEAEIVPIVTDGTASLMPAALLTTLPRAVAARAVRSALRRHLSPYPGSADDVEAVLTVAGGGATSHQVSGALRVEREGPFVALYVMGDTVPRPVSLVVPGRTVFGDHALRTELIEAGARHGTRTIHVDPATSDGSLEVRAVADGDRIEIRGGSKPVRQALAERGVPIRLRAAWPVLVADAKIVAVPAVRVATWATPAGATAMAITDERSIW